MCKRNLCKDCIFHIVDNGKDKCNFFAPGDGFYIGNKHYWFPNDVTILDRLFCRRVKKKARQQIMVQIDIEMPECCGDCPFCMTNGKDYVFCNNLADPFMYGTRVDAYRYDDKPTDCPLKKVE